MVKYWERLKPAMDAKKLDITALAAAMDISFQAVAKVRDGGAFGSTNNLKAAKLLGLNPEWLATGKGAKFVGVEHYEGSAPEALISNLEDWRLKASSKSVEVIDQLTLLAQKNRLRDEDWQLIQQLYQRFSTR